MGAELTFLCNDAYLPTVGLKRDWVIGSRSDKVWAEIWPDIGPRIHHVLSTGEATWDEALLLYLERRGFTEETYHAFSYSPLADDTGATTGMFCVVAEVIERVIGERQLSVLRDLGITLAAASTRAEVMKGVETCLLDDARDVPRPCSTSISAIPRHGRSPRPPTAHPSSSIFTDCVAVGCSRIENRVPRQTNCRFGWSIRCTTNKMFFSEEKNQKTFIPGQRAFSGFWLISLSRLENKSLLLLFFRKEDLSFSWPDALTPQRGFPAWPRPNFAAIH